MDDTAPDVVEGEIISSSPNIPPAGQTTLDLTGLINSHLDQISSLKDQITKFRDMIRAVLESDTTYQTHEAAVKEAAKIRNQTKKQIMKQPQVADIVSRMQTARTDIKELSQTLSGLLQDYARSTGTTSFETSDGQVREIVYSAKLISR